MKKQFFFAAAAVAALASCSSSDDALSTGAPEVGASNEQILIGVNAPAAILDVTRGTGTVGDLSSGTNVWAGQKINVYMFDKGTLDLSMNNGVALYDNAEMITPGATATGEDFTGAAAESGVAKLSSGELRYYPISGASDFWGYRADGANTVAPALNAAGDAYEVAVTIDGSQDIMVAKTADIDPAVLSAAGITEDDLFSAKAARKLVKPTLNFTHELTRLTFSIIGGNANAIASTAITQAEVNDYGVDLAVSDQVDKDFLAGTLTQGIYVDQIRVKTNTTGTLVCTGANQGLTLDGGEAWVTLQQRPAAGTASDDLEDLTPVKPEKWTGSVSPEATTVGEALLVNPSAVPNAVDNPTYTVEVTLREYVPVYEADYVAAGYATQKYTLKTSTKEYDVKLPLTAFASVVKPTDTKGYSFNIKMTAYSLENVEVSADLTPWEDGGEAELPIE